MTPALTSDTKNTLIAVFLAASLSFQSAFAAPLWIERQFIPPSELIDERFLTRDESSTTEIDHSAWTSFLQRFVSTSETGVNLVTYKDVDASAREELQSYIGSLQAVDVGRLNPDEQLAFWINLYNAVTIELILENFPLDSIRKINNAWTEKRVNVEDVALSLHEIESGVIRPVFQDPRIHYAVNCAAIGCPNLAQEAYTGARVNDLLDAGAKAYINHPRGVRIENGKLIVSKIYGWYREDFGASNQEVIDHLKAHAAPELRDALSAHRQIDKHEYDWSLNAR